MGTFKKINMKSSSGASWQAQAAASRLPQLYCSYTPAFAQDGWGWAWVAAWRRAGGARVPHLLCSHYFFFFAASLPLAPLASFPLAPWRGGVQGER